MLRTLVPIIAALLVASCAATSVNPWQNQPDQVQVHSTWQTSVPGSAGNYLKLSPAVSRGMVYIPSSDGTLLAVNAQTGATLWQKQYLEGISTGVVANARGVYFGTPAANLMAVNANNGKSLWQQPLSNVPFAKPALYNREVVVQSLNGSVYAFKQHNGHVLWSFDGSTKSMSLRMGPSPVIINHAVLAGFLSGEWDVLRAKTGDHLFDGSVETSIVDTPATYGNNFYVADRDGTIRAYRGQAVLWKQPLSSVSGIIATRDAIYATDTLGKLWAFNRRNGAVLWVQNGLQGETLSKPNVIGDNVVVGDSSGRAFWFARVDGSYEASRTVSNHAIVVQPLVVGDQVIFVSQSGDVEAFRTGF